MSSSNTTVPLASKVISKRCSLLRSASMYSMRSVTSVTEPYTVAEPFVVFKWNRRILCQWQPFVPMRRTTTSTPSSGQERTVSSAAATRASRSSSCTKGNRLPPSSAPFTPSPSVAIKRRYASLPRIRRRSPSAYEYSATEPMMLESMRSLMVFSCSRSLKSRMGRRASCRAHCSC